jgi:hypothetical protein
MGNFLAARGCVYEIPVEGNAGTAWYDVGGLDHGKGPTPVLVMGFTLDAVELAQPVVTLDNSKILYTFGSDFSAITVFGDILLGTGTTGGGAGMKLVQAFYNANRVSALQNSIQVSGPAGAYEVYLTGLQFGRVDPEFHIQPWAMQGVIAEAVGSGVA